MRKLLSTIVLMSFVLLGVALLDASGQDKKKGKGDKALQGSWTMTKGASKMSFAFKGKSVTLTKSRGDKDEDITGTFTVDPSKTPKTIDLTVTGGSSREAEKYKGKTSLGIYKVDGNKLEWCANEPGKEGRPSAFADTDGDKKMLYLTFERDKK